MLKDTDICYSQENIIKKTIGYKTRCCKNYFKKVVHKAGEFIENNIDKQELIGEIIIQSEKRDEILNKLRKAL